MKYARLDNFKAWCSGTAYQIPDISIVCEKYKCIQISLGDCILGRFFFRTLEDFMKAQVYLKLQQRKLQRSYDGF